MVIRILCLLIFCFLSNVSQAEDGYNLWLRYNILENNSLKDEYCSKFQYLKLYGETDQSSVAIKELKMGIKGLLGRSIVFSNSGDKDGIVIITTDSVPEMIISAELIPLGQEGYIIKSIEKEDKYKILLAANTETGILYGVFHLLRLLQTEQSIENLNITEIPKVKYRLLNHWDNLDRTVERGYAGFSIWNWHYLPDYILPRYIDYARANASIGINGTVLTNVNANAFVLTPMYLEKVAALANVFRPYGIKVYLTARFNAPVELQELETADPFNPKVQEWWKEKAKEIYNLIPDFGGFLVKANSEGQPGPQDYGRTHADGANLLADALAPYNGIVMWRAFVYSHEAPDDRAKQAYNEFVPLDGKFRDNVVIQVKNGAIDFQPREPFHPLFGATPKTSLAMEFQITQEYLGQGTHLVYLAPLYKECLESDTYVKGKGSCVSRIIDGSLFDHQTTCMAGVSNIGTDRNWTGHHFGQANWYAFGRLAWNHDLPLEQIAKEWLRMTFTNNENFVGALLPVMLNSRETTVNYMTPLGLHHIMGWNHHYGPAPWIDNKHRADWTSVYYHRADEDGVGFDRTKSGSNAVSQYAKPVAKMFSDLEKCPEKYLLWFHHVAWDYKMKSENTLWEEICYKYQEGVDSVQSILNTWNAQKELIDTERFEQVCDFLKIQLNEAKWWRDACLLYFQTFSCRPIPEDIEQPEHDLNYYMNLQFPYAPGIKPSW